MANSIQTEISRISTAYSNLRDLEVSNNNLLGVTEVSKSDEKIDEFYNSELERYNVASEELTKRIKSINNLLMEYGYAIKETTFNGVIRCLEEDILPRILDK